MNLKVLYASDSRRWYPVETVFVELLQLDDSSAKVEFSHIPTAYKKRLEWEGTRAWYVDELYLSRLVRLVEDYVVYDKISNHLLGDRGKYRANLAVEGIQNAVKLVQQVKGGDQRIVANDQLGQDLLHEFDNGTLADDKLLELGRQLNELRLHRRELKNAVAVHRLVTDFVESKGIKEAEVQQLKRDVEQLQRTFFNKTYRSRAVDPIHEEWKQQLQSFKSHLTE